MVCIDLETSQYVVSQQTSMTREGPMEAGQCPFTAARFSIRCRLVAEKTEELPLDCIHHRRHHW
jgi:hypothetical protein